MAQPPNLIVEDKSAVNFRADLNDILIALASLHNVDASGTPYPASGPTVTYPNMIWLDTDSTPNVLRLRNQADTAWITLGTVDQASGVFLPVSNDAGQVSHFAMSSPPPGWLEANGQAVSRTTYAALFAAIGTDFGVGDGSTTFNVPDMRGLFTRAFDARAGGNDPGRVFGSDQGAAVQSHSHTGSSLNVSISNNGRHRHKAGNNFAGGSGSSKRRASGAYTSDSETFYTDYVNDHSHTATVSGSTGNTGGNETRPINKALLACIKY